MKKPKVVKLICILLALIILWFLAVDMSWFVEDCHDCFYSRDIFEFRLFTLTLHRIVREHDSPITHAAEKLGLPCSHANVTRWHRQKWWGMLFCCRPCHMSIYRLSSSDDKDYKRLIDKNIQKLLKSNPNLPEEFQRRVLIEHDMEYWKQLRKKLMPKDILDEGT